MKKERVIINKYEFDIIIDRLAHQLIENHGDFSNSVIIGIQPRGVHLSNRIHRNLLSLISNEINIGELDITFYRDDLRRREEPIIPQTIDINFSVEEKNVILIDDVLYTGRSVRSAMDALLAFGRPKKVELVTFIDRRYSRHLPIQPHYVGKRVDSIASDRVLVEWKEINGKDQVILLNSEQ